MASVAAVMASRSVKVLGCPSHCSFSIYVKATIQDKLTLNTNYSFKPNYYLEKRKQPKTKPQKEDSNPRAIPVDLPLYPACQAPHQSCSQHRPGPFIKKKEKKDSSLSRSLKTCCPVCLHPPALLAFRLFTCHLFPPFALDLFCMGH